MLAPLLLAAGCAPETASTVPGRWYTATQVSDGQAAFRQHCAGCHGLQAQGVPDWRERDAAGRLKPPPLDGSAHAWHHPLAELQTTILEGNAALGGDMPGFGGALSEAEALAVIAFFQSLWTDDIYARWAERDRQARP